MLRYTANRGGLQLSTITGLLSGVGIAAFLVPVVISAQSSPGPIARPEQTATAAAGNPRTVAPDSRKIPLTAGGFADSGPVIFLDVTKRPASPYGATRWAQLRNSSSSKPTAPASA